MSFDPPSPSRNVFATRIPSTVTFAIGLLLFVLPFAELKCKLPQQDQNSLLKLNSGKFSFTNSGLGLALGNDWKFNVPVGNIFQNDQSSDWRQNVKSQKPNYYAMVALAMALLGLGLSFVNATPVAVITTFAGGIAAGSLIGLMIDLQNKSNEIISSVQSAGNNFNEKYHAELSLRFTPWLYIAIIAMLAAAIFSYKRILSAASNETIRP
jgi:hypothetical protein